MMIWAAVFPLLNPWTKTLGISHTQGGMLMAVFALFLVWSMARSPEGTTVASNLVLNLATLKNFTPAVWLIAVMYLFYNAGSDSYYTFSPDYLVRRGYALADASSVVGAYAW